MDTKTQQVDTETIAKLATTELNAEQFRKRVREILGLPPDQVPNPVADNPRKDTLPGRDAQGRFLKRHESVIAQPIKPKRVQRKRTAPEKVDDFVAWFFMSPEQDLYDVKCGQYECKPGNAETKTAHTLIFHSEAMKDEYVTKNGKSERITRRAVPEDANNIIGIRPPGQPLGVFNGSRLLYGTSHAAQKRPQIAAEKAGAIPVPFRNVVSKKEGAGMDLSKLEILAWSGSEKMVIPPVQRRREWVGDFYVIERHFAGALLMRVGDKYFLFDADREELKNFGFNPFFTQLPGPASSIDEAYKLLMPPEVAEAIKKGKEVKRQGEFFFVPVEPREIQRAVTGSENFGRQTRVQTLFTLKHYENMVREVGAAYYNWLCAERKRHVTDFIKRCENATGGVLPDVSDCKIRADEILGSYLTSLNTRVGSDLAQGYINGTDIIAKTKPEDYEDWADPNDTHLAGLADHLEEACGVAARRWNAPADEPLERTGAVAQDIGLMYNIRIGETPQAVNDWRQRQHRATGVLQPEEGGPVYALGTVIHEGREHRPVFLNDWHRVYANTATSNWTVSGDVD